MSAPSLSELIPHAAAMPSLPEVVNYLTKALSDEEIDVEHLSHHINADPAIVARLLSAANSVASGLSVPILSARQAFMVLGVDRIVRIILASALVYRYDMHNPGFDARLLWRHSLGVAICAQFLGVQTGINPELAFTGGLLHDIGQLLMFVSSPTSYLQSLGLRRRNDGSLIDAERSVFGYDHTEAGQTLAVAWALPTQLVEAIAAHHEPDRFCSEIGNLIHVSEVLSHALDLGEQPNNCVPALSDRACAQLGLSWSEIGKHFAEIEARYDGLRHALNV